MAFDTSDIEFIIEVAQDAGALISNYYHKKIEVKLKPDQSPVTIADKSASDFIIDKLIQRFPSIPCISEEDIIPDFQTRKNWELFWLIDPLDGTKEFINKTGEFTVNIALIQNNAPVFGIIFHPLRKETYYTDENQTVQVIDHKKRKRHLNSFSLKTKKLPQSLIVAGSRSHSSSKFNNYMNQLKFSCHNIDIKRLGSSYKFCLAATKGIDLYPRFGRTMEWDTAAGHAICKLLGINVYQFGSENDLIYNKKELANPWFLACPKIYFEASQWTTLSSSIPV